MARAIVLAVLGFINPILSRLLGEEVKAWMPWLTERLLCVAVAQLPPDQRERYAEEWASHLRDVPGEIGKVVNAVGFVFAAREITSLVLYGHSFHKQIAIRCLDIVTAVVLLLPCAPVILLLIVISKCLSRRNSILVKRPCLGLQNRRFTSYQLYVPFSYSFHATREQGAIVAQFTRWGEFLFRTGVYDLPNLLNVFRGDMTVVGPLLSFPTGAQKNSSEISLFHKSRVIAPPSNEVIELVRHDLYGSLTKLHGKRNSE